MVATNGTPQGDAVPNKGGRPAIFDEAVFEEIMVRIAHGETLRGVCRSKEHYPAASTIRLWVVNDSPKGVAERYARARESCIHEMIDDTVLIADDSRQDTEVRYDSEGNPYDVPNHEWINRTRLRVDTRKWLAAKVLPKLYGERVEIESKGTMTHEIGDSITGLLARIRGARTVTPVVAEIEDASEPPARGGSL